MRKFLIVITLTIYITSAFGQRELSLYNLNYSVSQSQELNPAFHSYHKVVFGFPGLGSTRLGFNTGQLSFNNIFTKQNNNSYTLDYDKLVNKLNGQNYINLNANIQLFHLALNLNENHFSLTFNERINSTFAYSDDIMKMAIYGNGHSMILDKNIDLGKLGFNQIAYHEIALGYARDINDKLTVGIKFKYLAGLTNVQLKKIEGEAISSEEYIHIEHQGFSANTAGLNLIENKNNEDISSLLTNTLPGNNKNTGIAFDLGANYQINDKMSVSAALTDLGFINWKEDTKEFAFSPVNYTFKGFEILKVIDNQDGEEYVENELDSLETLFTSKEIEGLHYKSSLTANINVGFDYSFYKNHHVGAVTNAVLFDGKIQTAIGAYYNFTPKRIINTTVNMALRNGKFSTVGLGASIEAGPLQIYGTTESLTSLIKPDKANIVNARIGINLVFGKNRVKKVRQEKVPDKIQAIRYHEPSTEEINEEELEIIDSPIEIKPAPIVLPKPENEIPVVIPQEKLDKDELAYGHYIIVGAFSSKQNAEAYSKQLTESGYDNSFGFLTEKKYYYVYVSSNIQDMESARKARDKYKSINQFGFPNAWILSIVK